MTREGIAEECAKVADERAQENFLRYEMLRQVNPDAAGNFNIAAREALHIAAAIRAAVDHDALEKNRLAIEENKRAKSLMDDLGVSRS